MPRRRSTYSVSTASGKQLAARGRARSSGFRWWRTCSRTHPGIAIRAHQVPAGSASGRRDSAKPRQANSTGAIAAGVALASGWPENGSVRGVTRSPIARRRGVEIAPVDRREDRAAPLRVADDHLEDAAAVRGAHVGEAVVAQPDTPRRRPDGPRRTAPAGARRASGSGPTASWCATGRATRPVLSRSGNSSLVALRQRRPFGRDEPRLAIGGEETAVGKQPSRVAAVGPAPAIAPAPAPRSPGPRSSASAPSRTPACRRSRMPTAPHARGTRRPPSDRKTPRQIPCAAPRRRRCASRAAPRPAAAGICAGARCAAPSW